jgi:hypothetical protein
VLGMALGLLELELHWEQEGELCMCCERTRSGLNFGAGDGV